MLWASTPTLTASEDGTAKPTIPYIHERASHLLKYAKKEAAKTKIMHWVWDIHVEAFYAQWGRRYLDPREAPWKSVLDHWIQ